MKNLIIGTAGHVDHGKTEIVRALTGRNTDRLEEEQTRGISIVLGFAPLDLGEGLVAGLVDVPGHEKFVKNMVSGATGVDMALMVVAADEGVMPQTVEHFEVLRLLGLDTAVIAITKVDLVDDEMAGIVESEVEDLISGTPLEGSVLVRTSSVTGEGIEELRAILREVTKKVQRLQDGDFFRLPVDRVFTRDGIGTIVTGTAWSGSVSRGDELVIEPGSRKARVRDVHNFDRALDSARAGMRTALALHGLKKNEISPGDQVMTPGLVSASSMLDVTVEISAIKGSRLTNRQRVRFHHAAGETLARVVLLDSEEIIEGASGLVQLRMESPVVALGGDRFILRTYSPMRVLAGGRILDPAAPKARRSDDAYNRLLRTVRDGRDGEIVEALTSDSGLSGLAPKRLRLLGLSTDRISAAIAGLGESVKEIEGKFFAGETIDILDARMKDILDGFSRKNPLLWGMEREQLRVDSSAGDGPLFGYLLEKANREKVFFFRDGKVRSGTGEMELSEKDVKILERISTVARESGPAFVTGRDLSHKIDDVKDILKYIHILLADGRLRKVGGDGYIDSGVFENMKKALRVMLADGKTMKVGDFKDRFGLTRKHAVPMLEFLDSERITIRKGDCRESGPEL
ncbi:MAG: selenocysteine-specific translation elongation factor [Candidatus Krumholzibacteria bacterium]|nr:selenocysteine-specific translation elongation factor [Candidatus Krumholzibacteria bacterium]